MMGGSPEGRAGGVTGQRLTTANPNDGYPGGPATGLNIQVSNEANKRLKT